MDEIDVIVEKFASLPSLEARVKAFTFVRDIAYGDIGSRDPMDVLHAKKGTCSGKHALLKLVLERLGYRVKTFLAKHDFRSFPIQQWPKELVTFREKTLTDYHDFLKIDLEGEWITLDAMFDSGLKELGFPVSQWDGKSDTDLPVIAEEILEVHGDAQEQKKRLIAALPQEVQKARREFLKEMTRWLDKYRKREAQPGGCASILPIPHDLSKSSARAS